jgi:hypothetical protein
VVFGDEDSIEYLPASSVRRRFGQFNAALFESFGRVVEKAKSEVSAVAKLAPESNYGFGGSALRIDQLVKRHDAPLYSGEVQHGDQGLAERTFNI